ncbi:MAG TPA: hypothetical protein VEX38_07095, partial [Fimbriimonadaceae bacterium]|nr:hypothetical protein [Fimbriimonadaceae bacterium]
MKRIPLSLMLTALALSAAWAGLTADSVELTQDLRSSTISALAKSMTEDYVFPELGEKAAKDIEARNARKEYDSIKSGEELAAKLTEHINAICKDAHFRVRFSEKPLPARAQRREPSPDEIRKMETFTKRMN